MTEFYCDATGTAVASPRLAVGLPLPPAQPVPAPPSVRLLASLHHNVGRQVTEVLTQNSTHVLILMMCHVSRRTCFVLVVAALWFALLIASPARTLVA